MGKTIEQGFDTLIGSLAPLNSEHNRVLNHKDSVERSLKNNFGCYEFFETGSFGNGTGVRHHSDSDFFAVCPTKELKENSATTLRQVKEALQSRFVSTEGIEVSTPAVKVPFGTYASETMEVTPCDFRGFVDTSLGRKATYDIADGNNEWIRSSPQAHNAYVGYHDRRLDYKLKPLIQLVKAWKFFNDAPIRSFYLELRITKYAEGESTIIYDLDLVQVMRLLNRIELASINDPMGISGSIKACSTSAKKYTTLSKLSSDLARAEKAYYQKDKNTDKCFEWWNVFFNGHFPSR